MAAFSPDGGGASTAFSRSGSGRSSRAASVVEGPLQIGEVEKKPVEVEVELEVEVKGEGAPAPADGLYTAGLAEAVLQNAARCGYESLTPLQRYVIPVAMAGRDLITCAKTESGKAAAFCLPIVNGLVAVGGHGGGRRGATSSDRAAPRALVLVPTREVAAQINDQAKKLSCGMGLRVVSACDGTSMVNQLRGLHRSVDFLVATPGRLLDLVRRSRVSFERIQYLVIDEADRMLYMGVEAQIREMVVWMNRVKKSERQTMLFSATFSPELQSLATEFMSNYIHISFGRVDCITDLIEQKVEFVNDARKRDFLMDLLLKQSVGAASGKVQQPLTLVFVETKREANSLMCWLNSKGFSVTTVHGDRTLKERDRSLRSFERGITPIMVATDTTLRDLDILNVAHLINYDLPKNLKDYSHRVGRAGRTRLFRITTLCTESNLPLAKGLLDFMYEANADVPEWLLESSGQGDKRPGSETPMPAEASGDGSFRADLLPNDIILNIAWHLWSSRCSVQAMRSVCPAWRAVVPNLNRPMLVLSRLQEAAPIVSKFVALQLQDPPNQHTMTAVHCICQPPNNTSVWGATSGCLALRLDDTDRVSLFCLNCGGFYDLTSLPQGARTDGIFCNGHPVQPLSLLSFEGQPTALCCEQQNMENVHQPLMWGVYPGTGHFEMKSVTFASGFHFVGATSEDVVIQRFQDRPGENVLTVQIPADHGVMVPWHLHGHHVFTCADEVYLCVLTRSPQDDNVVGALVYKLQYGPADGYTLIRTCSIAGCSVYLGANHPLVLPGLAGSFIQRADTIYVTDNDGVSRSSRVWAIDLSTDEVSVISFPAGVAIEDYGLGSWAIPPAVNVQFWHCSTQLLM